VEFVLVFPIFMMLLLGMFTGGIAYSRKLSLAQAVREGARYGATLPTPGTPAWLNTVAGLTIESSDNELATNQLGRYVCVAYVPASGVINKIEFVQGSSTGTLGTGQCATGDTRSEARVQVVARRVTKLEALLFSRKLVLQSQTVARFEATP
jgi:Flp pilus assembly protein TadG